MFIPSSAQTDPERFLNFLGTDSLRIYQDGELVFGKRPHLTVNHLTPQVFSSLLNTLENSHNSDTNWEITQGDTLLLASQVNPFKLGVSPHRLERGLTQGEFSLGQALCGYWKLSDTDPQLLGVPPIFQSISEAIQPRESLNPSPSDPLSLTKTGQPLSNSDDFTKTPRLSDKLPDNHSATSPDEDNNSLISEGLPQSSTNSQAATSLTPTLNQQFIHHLFEHLRQQKRLRYQDGKAIVTLNGETLVAQLNQDNQWEYVKGSLFQLSLLNFINKR